MGRMGVERVPYSDPEQRRRKQRERYWADPEKHRERSLRRYHSDPEYREANKQRARDRKRTPADRERAYQRMRETRQELRRLVGQIKMQRGCVDCGYAERPEALQFDHVKDTKIRMISSMVNRGQSWAAIAIEIAKCEVRCANCHAIRTMERLQHLGKLTALDLHSCKPEQLSLMLDE